MSSNWRVNISPEEAFAKGPKVQNVKLIFDEIPRWSEDGEAIPIANIWWSRFNVAVAVAWALKDYGGYTLTLERSGDRWEITVQGKIVASVFQRDGNWSAWAAFPVAAWRSIPWGFGEFDDWDGFPG